MKMIPRPIGVHLLVLFLICTACSPKPDPGPTVSPTLEPTIASTDVPNPFIRLTATSTSSPPPAPTDYAIQDEDFQDVEQECKTDVNITSVSGDTLSVSGGPISMINGDWAIFCYGARHTWIGTLTYAGYTFTSDDINPLQFMVTEDEGYIYVQGNGSVTTPDGETVALGSGVSQEQASSSKYGELIFSDRFDSNEFDWPEGKKNDSDRLGNCEITGGVYSWTIESLDGYVGHSQIADIDNIENFYASVDVERFDGARDAAYGIIFRVDNDWYYYEFLICDFCGEYNINLYKNDEWIVLVDWKTSDTIKSYGTNQLAVLAEGSKFQFFINGELVQEYQNTGIRYGAVGLTIEVYSTGDKVTVHFDNFEVYVP
jgi:hypothetical protein